jgi:hypothetical protein
LGTAVFFASLSTLTYIVIRLIVSPGQKRRKVMQGGQDGMGRSQKFSVSGHVGKSARQKSEQARLANQEIERNATIRRKRARAQPMFGSVTELLKFHDSQK